MLDVRLSHLVPYISHMPFDMRCKASERQSQERVHSVALYPNIK